MLLINKGPNLKSYGKKQRHNIEFRFSQTNINSLLLNGTCELESLLQSFVVRAIFFVYFRLNSSGQ